MSLSDHESGRTPTCSLCGKPMPPGEEMFKFHGYSGPCPKPTPKEPAPSPVEPAGASEPPSAFTLGQEFVSRVTSSNAPEGPSVIGPIERDEELVTFALELAVATLGAEGCACQPEEPCALCMCKEAVAHLRDTSPAPVSPVEPTPPAGDEDDDEVPAERAEGAPDAWSAPLRKPVVPKILSTDDFYALLRILEVLPADPFLSALQAKLSDEERRQHGNQASHLSGSEFVREIERVEALIQGSGPVRDCRCVQVEPTPEPPQDGGNPK